MAAGYVQDPLASLIKTAAPIRHQAPPGQETETEAARLERSRFYSNSPWRRLRKRHLQGNPLCVMCRQAGRIRAATEVHHIVKRLDDSTRALDPTNLQSLCSPCHRSLPGSRR